MMPINPLKEFFKRKKTEAKFSKAGPGQTLSSNSQPTQSSSSGGQSDARQAAAEAAMKRFNKDNTKQVRPKVVPSDLPKPKPATQPANSPSAVNRDRVAQTQKELPMIDGIPQRDIQIFTTEELASRIKNPEIDDDFFRLTVEDAKLFQQRFAEEREKNETLRTSEMRREAETKKPTTNVARLRFKLPNDIVLEASFSGNETLGMVRDWLVASCIDKVGLELKDFDILMALRPFKEDDFNKSVKQLSLIPATTLIIVQKNLA